MLPTQKDDIKEGLHLQSEMLAMMQSRHLSWANGTGDLEARQKHLEIADKLKETREQYRSLLEVYIKATKQSE